MEIVAYILIAVLIGYIGFRAYQKYQANRPL